MVIAVQGDFTGDLNKSQPAHLYTKTWKVSHIHTQNHARDRFRCTDDWYTHPLFLALRTTLLLSFVPAWSSHLYRFRHRSYRIHLHPTRKLVLSLDRTGSRSYLWFYFHGVHSDPDQPSPTYHLGHPPVRSSQCSTRARTRILELESRW